MSVVRIACLMAALAAAPVALAAPGQRAQPEQMAEQLEEHLGVSPEVAEQIAAIVAQAKEEGQGLRERGRALSEALREAKEAGDDDAMRSLLRDIAKLRREAEDLRQVTHRDATRLMTTEQEATWVLWEVRRHRAKDKALQHLKRWQAYDEL
ncbi:MAG: hypothetical protein KTR31_26760 [Myxococcales bacterium]|nr:hypothetical protein [Myxococcales bacterium]